MHQYSRAIVRRPAWTFANGITTSLLGPPDYTLALVQHDSYCETLERCGVKVSEVSPDELFPDCCFVEDTAVMVAGQAVITNPGHHTRKGEQEAIEARFMELGVPILGRIAAPGTLDGGDVLRISNHYYIGLSERTNTEGACQLGALLEGAGMTWSTVKVSQLHLKTDITAVDSNILVSTEAYYKHPYFSHIKTRIEVPQSESIAANCLSVNGHVLVPAKAEQTQSALKQIGVKVRPINMTEFNKMDGALTCLSLLF